MRAMIFRCKAFGIVQLCSTLSCLCLSEDLRADEASRIVERLTDFRALPNGAPLALRIARTSLVTASLSGEDWNAVSGIFRTRSKLPSPQAPDLVALVSPRFADDGDLKFDYWIVAWRQDRAVGLSKAAFRALDIHRSSAEVSTKCAGTLTARVLALEPVQKVVREFPVLKAIEFECRPLSSSAGESQAFLLEAVITHCAKPDDGKMERLRIGAELRVDQNDGSQEVVVTRSNMPRLYLREQDGTEVFYELGGLRVD